MKVAPVEEARMVAPAERKVRLRGNPNMALISTTASFFVGFAAVSLFGPTTKHLKQLLKLTPMQCSWLMAVPVLTGSLLRIPGGAMADASGARHPILVLMGISIAGMLGVTLLVNQISATSNASQVYCMLLLLGSLCGCGIATFSAGISQVSYWFPQAVQGKVLGRYAGIGTLSPGLAALALPQLLTRIGLVGTYVAWLSILIAGTLFYFFTGHNAWFYQLKNKKYKTEEARAVAAEVYGQELFPSGSAVQGLKNAASVWQTWALVSIYFVTFGGHVAMTNWLITFWSELHDLKLTQAGPLASMFSLTGASVRAISGPVADRLGGERSLLLALTVILIGSVMLKMCMGFHCDFAATLIVGVGMGWGCCSVFKLVPQVVPHAVGGAAGWVGGLGAFGGFVVPPLMASFVREGVKESYADGFIVFVVESCVALVAASSLCLCSAPDESDDSSSGSSASEDDAESSSIE